MTPTNLPTATTVLDSILFRDSFGTPRMREIFADRALISKYVQVGVALARAEARCGVIPAEAAEEIAARSKVDALDFELLRQETEIVGYPILPLVHQLAKMCGESGGYVHWGATTQDIMDTAVVLQVRDALEVVESELRDLRAILGAPREALSRYANGGPHPPAAGAAGHVRLQGRGLARHVRPASGAFDPAASAGAGGRVRRRRGNARLARRPRARSPESDDGGARPRRAGSDVACRPRRARRGR